MGRWRVVVQERVAVGAPASDVPLPEWTTPRPRDARWIAVLYRDERRVFDSRSVSIELETERAARWLARLVCTAYDAGVFAPPGSASVPSHRAAIAWAASSDESTCEHAGHRVTVGVVQGSYDVALDGPRSRVSVRALAADARVRTPEAGRFLGELVLDLTAAGHTIPSAAELGA